MRLVAIVDKPTRTDKVVYEVVVANIIRVADVDGDVFLDGILSATGGARIAIISQMSVFVPEVIYGRKCAYTTTGLISPLLNDQA